MRKCLVYKGIAARRPWLFQRKGLRTVILPNGEYKNYGSFAGQGFVKSNPAYDLSDATRAITAAASAASTIRAGFD
jgi:hypothetical protein